LAKAPLKPVLFSAAIGIDPAKLAAKGVFDPTLNVDTLLFPDPLLLEESGHAEMRAARTTFDDYFDRERKLIAGSKAPDDAPAKAAKRLLRFPEIKGTCLGYGANSIIGAGVGKGMTDQLFKTASQIISLGIDDPDLFLAMGLFEENFGPDLVGDMFTNVCFGNIIEFNRRINKELAIPASPFSITLGNGNSFAGDFVRNPTAHGDVPVILLPVDLLRDLPVAVDWRGVQTVAAENKAFRASLNESVAQLWATKTLESKSKLKAWALSGPEAFGNLLDMVHGHEGKPYDFIGDPHGELIWRTIGEKIAEAYPLKIEAPKKTAASDLIAIVSAIVDQFTFLIEKRDLWRELYHQGKPRLEKAAQRIFYAVAVAYCDANGIDITPEAETGRGPVDFKFSTNSKNRVLVEVKLSTNPHLRRGFEKQLAIYDEAEMPVSSTYLVIDVGKLDQKKREALEVVRLNHIVHYGKGSQLRFVDGVAKPSASKVK
jgi:hypothetical protein